MVSSINEITITLSNNQGFETKSYIEDNGEIITINIPKFIKDLEEPQTDSTDLEPLSLDEAPVYRRLSVEGAVLSLVTFRGFNFNDRKKKRRIIMY